MNGKFTSFMIDELRRLISELEGAKQPVNEELSNAVMKVLRPQHEENENEA